MARRRSPPRPRLRLGLGRRAVELEEERGRDGQVELEVAVDGVDLDVVDSSIRATGIAWARTSMHGVDRGVEGREGAAAAVIASGVGCSAQRDLADQAERALRADEQAGEVVARGGLARARAGADDLAVGGDHGEREDVLAHRAVADRGRPGRAGGDHPADRRVRAGVDREEHALGPQLARRAAARHARLHGHVHVLDRQPQDPVDLRMSTQTPP